MTMTADTALPALTPTLLRSGARGLFDRHSDRVAWEDASPTVQRECMEDARAVLEAALHPDAQGGTAWSPMGDYDYLAAPRVFLVGALGPGQSFIKTIGQWSPVVSRFMTDAGEVIAAYYWQSLPEWP